MAGRTPQLPTYFKALQKELLSYERKLKNYSIKTIYFGGGTPSLVDASFIKETVEFIKNNFEVDTDAEISIESNPENITEEKLQTYLDSGFTRISIGLQAWQDRILSYLGRLYTIDKFVEVFKLVKKSGFKNINVDLIFGIPNQTLKDWKESVDNLIDLGPTHISCYSLEVDEESIFGKLEKMGKFFRAKESTDRKMYNYAKNKLKEARFNHYEISNFAKSGFECKHNLSVWNFEEYIGLGASAHSYFDNKRYNNVYSIEKYIASILLNKSAQENVERIGNERKMKEYILVHLRQINGIDLKEFEIKFKQKLEEVYKSQVSSLQSQKLIKLTENNLKLTSKGLDVENIVAMEFV